MINPELYKKLNSFIKRHNFNITPSRYDKAGYLDLEDAQPTKSLESLHFLEHTAVNHRDAAYYKFIYLLEEEIKSWSNELLLNAYEHTSNAEINNILTQIDNTMRYLTHPQTLDKINKKTLKTYSRLIQNEEQFIIYFQKVISHPYWSDKEDFLKSYLTDSKKIKALNSLYPDASQSEVEMISTCLAEASEFTINFNLLPNNREGSNHLNNNISAISSYCTKMIGAFNHYAYADSPIKTIMTDNYTPSDGKKSIMVVGTDKYINLAFTELLFERLKLDLKEKIYVNENSGNFLNEKTIKDFMKEVITLGMQKKLEDNLETKQIKKLNKL